MATSQRRVFARNVELCLYRSQVAKDAMLQCQHTFIAGKDGGEGADMSVILEVVAREGGGFILCCSIMHSFDKFNTWNN